MATYAGIVEENEVVCPMSEIVYALVPVDGYNAIGRAFEQK